MAVGYLTSSTLIDSVKRRALIPSNQKTFKDADFLALANEEIDLGLVPSILQYHEEYFSYEQSIPLVANQSNYSIPYRAIGGKLRDVCYKDASGNLVPMTRIAPEERVHYQQGSNSTLTPSTFYLRGNDVVIVPNMGPTPTGSLVFLYYLRPNDLVDESRISIISSIDKSTKVITGINVGTTPAITEVQKITYAGEPFTGSYDLNYNGNGVTINYDDNDAGIQNKLRTVPGLSSVTVFGDFNAGYTITFVGISGPVPLLTVTNSTIEWGGGPFIPAITEVTHGAVPVLVTAPSHNLNTGDYIRISNSNCIPIIDGVYTVTVITSDTFTISATVSVAGTSGTLQIGKIVCSNVPSNITAGSLVDILQAKSGHKTRAFDITALVANSTSASIQIDPNDIPSDLVAGDHIATSGECMIPQVPSDLHPVLAQRVAARCLEALGDTQGLTNANTKLEEMEKKTGSLVDDRTEGEPQKVNNWYSPLRGARRRRRGWY